MGWAHRVHPEVPLPLHLGLGDQTPGPSSGPCCRRVPGAPCAQGLPPEAPALPLCRRHGDTLALAQGRAPKRLAWDAAQPPGSVLDTLSGQGGRAWEKPVRVPLPPHATPAPGPACCPSLLLPTVTGLLSLSPPGPPAALLWALQPRPHRPGWEVPGLMRDRARPASISPEPWALRCRSWTCQGPAWAGGRPLHVCWSGHGGDMRDWLPRSWGLPAVTGSGRTRLHRPQQPRASPQHHAPALDGGSVRGTGLAPGAQITGRVGEAARCELCLRCPLLGGRQGVGLGEDGGSAGAAP